MKRLEIQSATCTVKMKSGSTRHLQQHFQCNSSKSLSHLPFSLLRARERSMSNGLGFVILSMSSKSCLFSCNFFPFDGEINSFKLKRTPIFSASLLPHTKPSNDRRSRRRYHTFKPETSLSNLRTKLSASSLGSIAQVVVEEEEEEEEEHEVEIVEGYTITQFCDKIIDVFLNEKPRSKDWRKLLVFREDWKKYKESFYKRCQARIDTENDTTMRKKLIVLRRKVKKVDDEMEMHTDLLKEIEQSPTDINAVVARRRKDFTEEFFCHLTLLSETAGSLEDRDAMARLGAKCLSAVCAYDNTLENVEMLDAAQVKFDDILNSPSLDAACAKIKSLAKAKELDSSLILLINSAWASAKESATMKNEVKDIMYHIYKATKSSLRSIAPKEIKLLKHLLNIIDPEERFSALATAFSPGNEHEAKDPNALYTSPKELHKWIKIMLDAYHLNKEETDMREARQMTHPVVIQRLLILKETIEEEYLKQTTEKEEEPKSEEL